MREEALLAQVRVLIDKHEALANASGQSFNLFVILGRETDEVRTHSAILAELLDPKGSHRQGAVFARLFAKRVGIDEKDIERACVQREVMIGNDSRADIRMRIGDTRIVIENKIYADDQPRQLERYHNYAEQGPNGKVFYLTLHGDEPSEYSLGKLPIDKVECISYESHVLDWLGDCIKEVALVPRIREILTHYQTLLRKLTGKSTGELAVEIKELLKVEQGGTYNFELVPAITEAMTALSVDAEWEFWKMLKQRLENISDRSWRLTTVEGIEDTSNPPKEVSEKIVRHAHGSGRNKWDYGCTFRTKSDRERNPYCRGDVEVLLRVECDGWAWGFYGLIAVKRTPSGKCQMRQSEDENGLFGEWAQRMSELEEEGWRTDTEWWLAWRYPTKDIDLRKTTWLAPAVIRAFMAGEAVDPFSSAVWSGWKRNMPMRPVPPPRRTAEPPRRVFPGTSRTNALRSAGGRTSGLARTSRRRAVPRSCWRGATVAVRRPSRCVPPERHGFRKAGHTAEHSGGSAVPSIGQGSGIRRLDPW